MTDGNKSRPTMRQSLEFDWNEPAAVLKKRIAGWLR
jgi:hypothetical protein